MRAGDRRNCPARRSAKWPTPAWAAATCWPSGSARATRSRPASCARRRPQSHRRRRDLLLAQPRPARAARGAGAATPRAAAPRRWRPERIAVTSSGVNALMLAMQALAGAGDEVVAVVPVWPNLTAQPAILGAHGHARAAAGRWAAPGGSTWTRCCAAVTPRTRVLLVNAPNNPTGWTLTRAEQQAILDALPPHRHLDRGRRGLRARLLRADGDALRAELPGHRRARRPAGRRAQLLEELPDDRLAAGLAGGCRRRWSTRWAS